MMTTQADYWLAENGRWRTCRKPFKCDGLGGSLPEQQCEHEIQAGEQYLDTGETRTWPNTHRMCQSCATKPSKVLVSQVSGGEEVTS